MRGGCNDANGLATTAVGGGGLTGGHQCHMSISRNGNIPCH